MRKCVAILIALCVGLISGCRTARPDQAAHERVYTLCELAINPSMYAGKVVRVSAIYMTDMLEHSLLIDPACKSVHISLYEAPKGLYQPSIDKFNQAMFKVHQELKPVIFKVDFSAIFRTAPLPQELAFSQHEQGRLHLTLVWSYSWLPSVPKMD